nr:retrovirus-related Pol polyprotein from transposon TNT 1-94 [Tanacetum cinerariifolium]
MKVEESLNMTFDERSPPTKLSPLVDDDVGEEEAIKNNTKVVNNSNKEDESIEVDEVISIKESKNHPLEQVIAKIMHDEFEMSMMGELNLFLGLQVKQIKDGIFFNQSKYIKEMLKKFMLEDSKPTKTSMSTEIKLTKDDEADSVDCIKYQGRFVAPSFIEANNMLLSFQAIGLEPFLTLDEPICPRFVSEFYHSLEVKRDEEERPYIEFKLS